MDEPKQRDFLGLVALNDFRKKSGLSCSFMIFAALNLAMLIIGAKHLDECPVSHMIPVYLIVAGTTSLLLLVGRLLLSHVIVPHLQKIYGGNNRVGAANEETNVNEQKQSDPDKQHFSLMMYKVIKVFDSVASIFSTCWMIVGSIYVYGKWTIVSWEENVVRDFTTTELTAIQNDNTTDIITTSLPNVVANPNYCIFVTYMFAFVVITIGYVSLCISIIGAICTCYCSGSDSEDE